MDLIIWCAQEGFIFFKTAKLVKCALLNAYGSCMQRMFYLKTEI